MSFITPEYLLDKYMPFSFWDDLKHYIVATGVEIVDEPLKFLPGYTNISVCHKPHHIDPFVRQVEEELFMLHDLLHLLFPMKLDCFAFEYEDRQVLGEYFVFFITEYYVQHYLTKNNILGEEYNDYIFNKRNYFHLLDDILFRCDYRLVDAIKLLMKGKYPEVSDMFLQDRLNSRNNYFLASDYKDYSLKVDFCRTVECHHKRYQRILRGHEKQYCVKLIDLPNDWI